MIDISYLQNIKKEIKIVGHPLADFDSMASGYLLQYVFHQLGISARYTLLDQYVNPYFVEIAKELDFSYELSYDLKDDDALFLVDHTAEYSQSVLGCFDHHPTVVPVEKNYIKSDKTCCALLIYEWALSIEISIPKEYTTLVIYACYLDSLSFKSTKASPEDQLWCQEQIRKLGLEESTIRHYGYMLTDRKQSYEDFLMFGKKTYTLGEKLIHSSYAVVDNDLDDFDIARNIFYKELTGDAIAWCYLQSNIVTDTTRILLVTKDFTLSQTVNKLVSRGKNIIPAVLKFLSFDNDGTITDTLIQKELKIATMESCTSGLIASTITDYEGASAILSGSTITYSNNAKVMAGVSQNTIDHYGVYSSETATAMALQTKATFQSDISIGITGSFSNVDPNNQDSVAGTIFYDILYRGNELPIKLVYHNLDLSRKEIKQRTVDIVLATLSAMLS